VKEVDASENYVRRKFIEKLPLQGATLQEKKVRWRIVETTNIKAEDGIKKHKKSNLNYNSFRHMLMRLNL
jgi:hypothetical protein